MGKEGFFVYKVGKKEVNGAVIGLYNFIDVNIGRSKPGGHPLRDNIQCKEQQGNSFKKIFDPYNLKREASAQVQKGQEDDFEPLVPPPAGYRRTGTTPQRTQGASLSQGLHPGGGIQYWRLPRTRTAPQNSKPKGTNAWKRHLLRNWIREGPGFGFWFELHPTPTCRDGGRRVLMIQSY